MAGNDFNYGLELLAGAVARGADGIAATNDGGRETKRRIVRALQALEAEGLAEVIATRAGIVGAQLTLKGRERGEAIAAGSAAPARVPGDVSDVVIVRKGGLGEVD